MLRETGIEEIFDGHYYTSEDMVPVGVNDCAGCSACCQNTGDSVILDPYDIYMLRKGTGLSFSDMLEQEIEIRRVDGLILPNLMKKEGKCPFLTGGRCGIYGFRPGVCRLYPMGRCYVDGRFYYIVQKDECTEREKTLVSVYDWLGIRDLPRYEIYIQSWHDFVQQAREAVLYLTDKSRDSVTRYILQIFFVHPYEIELDFYAQYRVRMEVCMDSLGDLFRRV